jgi:hypothetical protein
MLMKNMTLKCKKNNCGMFKRIGKKMVEMVKLTYRLR